MTRFTAGAEVEDFFFIGLQERFAEDVALLGEQLNWAPVTVPHQNVSATDKQPLSKEELALLLAWNAVDVALYVRVLTHRELSAPVVYQDFC